MENKEDVDGVRLTGRLCVFVKISKLGYTEGEIN